MRLTRILALLIGVLTAYPAACQTGMAAFYNVENLFDPANDPAADDGGFTPEGIYRWDEAKYRHKLGQVARVIGEIGADLLGLAEVENARVLDDLTTLTDSEARRYRYIHFESSDPRGIDVALLYRPQRFVPERMQPVPHRYLSGRATREALHVSGRWNGHPVHILVCHLPSVTSAAALRHDAAASVGAYADSLAQADPDHLLLVMGDFNANPGSRPMNALVRGSRLKNPFEALYRRGIGTYLYRNRWNLYDGILIGGAFRREPKARVYVKDYLIQRDGPYRGYPYRSFSGTEYIGGYSDHLPVVLVFR